MTTSKRLAAFRAAKSGDDTADTDPTRPPVDEEDESTADPKEGTKKKEKPMADESVSAADHASALAAATAKATQEANARYSAVLASDEYQGREALATTLLGNASMDAPSIVAALAAAPKASAPAATAEELKQAEERGAQKAMREAQAGDNDSSLEDGGESKPDTKAKAASVWDRANAKIEQRRKGN